MKSKILIITILIGSLFSNSILAQEKNEINLSYGYSGVDVAIPIGLKLADGFGHIIGNAFTETFFGESIPFRPLEIKRSGTITANYNRRINKRISLGGQLNYSHFIYKREGDKEWEHISVPVPFAKFSYRHVVKPEFELYSSALVNPIIKDGNVLFHITGLGFRAGTKHALLGEFGFGHGHLISVGYSLKYS